MKDLTLVVMAAGMGSRFGGLKQITPVDDDGNFLLDYSIYDAIQAGFKKVVFIIKEENLVDFQNTVGKRIEDKIEVAYAFQRIEDIPSFANVPENRVKPWGTVHAILSAKELIDGPFAVINADDFYGSDAYQLVADFLNKEENFSYQVAIPYPFYKVDSPYGFVKRGVLYFNQDNVSDIFECEVGYENAKTIAKPLNGNPSFEISKDHLVSMNMFGFQQSILDELSVYFEKFMRENENNLETCECLLPDFLREKLKGNQLILKYRASSGEWIGMTYKEDLESVKEKINGLKLEKKYHDHLWE